MSVITISQVVVPNYQGGGSTAQLRIAANDDFLTSDNVQIFVSGVNRTFYKIVNCTVSGTDLTIPDFTIDTTTDSSKPAASYNAVLFDSAGRRVSTYWFSYQIPTIFGTTATHEQIRIYNDTPKTIAQYGYPNIQQVQAMLQSSVASSNTLGISNLGNTAGTSGVVSGSAVRFLLAGGNNITLSQSLNGQSATVSIIGGAGGGGGSINLSAGATSQNLTSFVLSNSNGVSFGLNGSTVTASHNGLTAQSVQTQNLVSVLGSTGNISFQNANGITFGGNGSTLTASHDGITNQSIQTENMVSILNSTGNISFKDANGITFGGNGSSVTASHNGITSQSIQTQNMVSVLGSTGNISFANGNGITFGGNASTLTASHNGLTSQSNQALSGSNGSFTFQTASFGNANGMSFLSSNGSMVGSYTVPTVTNSSWSVSDAASSGTVARLAFTNLNGVTLSLSTGANGSHTIVGSHNALTSQSVQTQSNVQGISAGTQVGRTGDIAFANSNGITFGMSGSSQVTASHNGITSQTVQTQSNVQALFDGANSIQTGTARFSNSNGVSFGINGQTITASHNGLTSQSNQALSAGNGSFAFQTASFSNANGISFSTAAGSAIVASHNGITSQSNPGASGSNGSFSFQTLSFGNLNGMSFYTSNGSIVASYTDAGAGGGISAINVSAGSTSNNLTNFVLSNSNNVSFGLNGSTVTASAGRPQLQYFEIDDIDGMALMTNVTAINTRPIFIPFNLPGDLTHASLMLQMSRSTSGSNAFTIQAGLYTYVNATSINLLGSLQNAFSASNTASISGVRYMVLSGWETAASQLSAGAYVLALNFSANGGNTASMNYSLFGGITASAPVGIMSQGSDNNNTTNTSFGVVNFFGRYTVGSAAIPTAVGQSQILAGFTGASAPLQPWFLLRP